jgi:hypothetical protein
LNTLFVDFLHRNGALLRERQPVINDIGLAALALLVAESAPSQKKTIVRLIESMLAGHTMRCGLIGRIVIPSAVQRLLILSPDSQVSTRHRCNLPTSTMDRCMPVQNIDGK